MSEIERQIRAYAETLDGAAPSVEELAERSRSSSPERRRRAIPSWVMAAGAAALVAITVGSAFVLGSLREPTEEGASTSVTAVTSTTLSDPASTTAPTPVVGPSEYVSLVSDLPIYRGGEDGDVPHPRVSAGPVVLDDGVYHTLFAAGGDEETWEKVYHAVSVDGTTWQVDPDPVTFPGVEGAASLFIGSMLRLDDGTWAAYFDVAYDVGGHGNHIFEYAIRRATAADPAGPWQVDSEPLLLPTKGTWDEKGIMNPSVFVDQSGWRMYYTGHSGEAADPDLAPEGMPGASAMGLAESPDGIVWTKHEMPVFTGDQGSPWEEGAVSRADVAWLGDRYAVLYAGRTGGSRGLATSVDGFDWVRVDDEPILTSLDLPRPAIFSTSWFVDDGANRLYVSNGGYRTTSSVYEMTIDVP